jgi:hypothetical protein
MKMSFEGIVGAVRATDGETCWRHSALMSLAARWGDENVPWYARRLFDRFLKYLWELPSYNPCGRPRPQYEEAKRRADGSWR